MLSDALQDDETNAAKLRAVFCGSDAELKSWEAQVFAAGDGASSDAREAGWGEALTEYEGLAQRWNRVPRVCANVATSAGFFFASISLIEALGRSDVPPVAATLFPALDCLAIGVAATSFCAAVHVRAMRSARARVEAAFRLITRLAPR